MAKLIGTNINAQIVPNLDNDTYPTHSDEYGKGGYRAVNTIEERDSISYERRSIGMEVRVLSGEGAGVYFLKSFEGDEFDGVTAQEWELVVSPGAGSSEKLVFSGFLETDGKFYQEGAVGTSPVLLEGIVGAIYLDIRTGISYHWDGDSYNKLNTLVWNNVE